MMNDEKIIDVEINEEKITKKPRTWLKVTALVLSCCILSAGFGYAGASLAIKNGENLSNKEIFYQSVVQTKADGSEVEKLSTADVAANAKDSVVEITTSSVQTNFFLQQFVSSGAGSGVIISSDGTIITNHHVIDGATSIKVRLTDGTEHDAELVGSDPQSDIAILKIKATGLKAAVMGNSDELIVGEDVVAIGNPLGKLGGSVTDGIVSAKDREITIDGQTMTLLQTSAAINPGNSGGGLFNSRGELIGIVNAKSSGSDVEGLGFAIPINTAKYIAEELLSNGSVSGRLTLGISYMEISSVQAAMQYGVNTLGLYIKEVLPDSNAERASFKAEDCLIAVDGEQITTSAELKSKLQKHQAGDTMTFTVIRDRTYVDLSVVLQ